MKKKSYKVILFKSQTLKNGEHPIMLRCRENGKYKHVAISVSCHAADWKGQENHWVASSDRQSKAKNEAISKFMKSFEDTNVTVTTSLTKAIKSSKIKDFILMYIDEAKSYETQKKYKQLLKIVGDDEIHQLNQRYFDKIVETYQGVLTERALFDRLKYLRSVFNRLKKDNYIASNSDIKVQEPVTQYSERNLTLSEWSEILLIYKFNKDNDSWGKTELSLAEQGLSLFILMVAMQGLSPIDICLIKKKDITIKEIDTIEYDVKRAFQDAEYKQWYSENNTKRRVMMVNLARQKSGSIVKVVIDPEPIQPILDYYNNKDGEYLIDCLSDSYKTNKQITKRVSNWLFTRCKNFNEYLETIVSDNGLRPIKKLTFYFARHTFINKCSDLGIPLNDIERMVGHKAAVLSKYYLAPLEDLKQADITLKLFKPIQQDVSEQQGMGRLQNNT